ncbi:MAG: pyridoxal-phosphate dependent enzyme [Deltaproteobacteria bacterium]|nr:pyridoxal-phosphate dependent enzyme [Deltaproteobacteria bacterium]MBT6503842.1 pyridoxal-phosphate dependent enzyme [Deltaproteobacteria bacterium]MBT7714590.1 pyridoxal-phosphate dependent enzyme [Deltaproteobacteria bacterium]
MIDLTVHPDILERAVGRARERQIIVPTFKQQRDPGLIPYKIVEKLKHVGLSDINPLNLFRITWHNEPRESGGGFGGVNFLEFPRELTGVDARIVAVVGKWFPTGAHKVGAAFGCLVPRLVTGQFDPTTQKSVWPSTGNYCRGGAYDAALLACDSIAILPEEMSRERFEWLQSVAGEVIRTPGSESNVKEIFDKCWELRNSGQDLCIFNQFDELGNYLWHHEITGPAMEEVLQRVMGKSDRFRGVVSATGSGGTIAAGDYLKKQYPLSKIVASEALQCPTLLNNGFGAHRIEGIGDKHIPWIHNAKNTDFVTAIDDEIPMSLIRLFNEPKGQELLKQKGVSPELVNNLDLVGISGASNLVSAIKFAKYYEMDSNDVIMTVLTDSMDLYGSRLQELTTERGAFSETDAAIAYENRLQSLTIDYMEELTYYGRKRIHNLKYYTWVEQQGKTYEEIQEQWTNDAYWTGIVKYMDEMDELIEAFNEKTGLLKAL